MILPSRSDCRSRRPSRRSVQLCSHCEQLLQILMTLFATQGHIWMRHGNLCVIGSRNLKGSAPALLVFSTLGSSSLCRNPASPPLLMRILPSFSVVRASCTISICSAKYSPEPMQPIEDNIICKGQERCESEASSIQEGSKWHLVSVQALRQPSWRRFHAAEHAANLGPCRAPQCIHRVSRRCTQPPHLLGGWPSRQNAPQCPLGRRCKNLDCSLTVQRHLASEVTHRKKACLHCQNF